VRQAHWWSYRGRDFLLVQSLRSSGRSSRVHGKLRMQNWIGLIENGDKFFFGEKPRGEIDGRHAFAVLHWHIKEKLITGGTVPH